MTTPLALPRPGTLRPALERLLGHRAFVPGVALLGLLARLALVGLFGGELRFWDERDYDRIARALLAGEGFDRGFGPTAFRPPGQPVFLAALQALGATARMVEAAQALLLTPLTFLGSRLARELGARPAAAGAVAAAIALHPGLAYGSATLFPVVGTALLLGLGLPLAARAVRRGRVRAALGGGLALGLAASFTPYFAPLPLLAAGLAARRAPRRRLAVALALALVGLAPTGAWVLRNAIVLGSPTLGTHGGYNLALGANDRATPRSGNHIEPDRPASLPADELGRDAAMRAVARRWIAAHPGRWLGLAAGRAVAVLDSAGRPTAARADFGAAAQLLGGALSALVLLGLVGLWRRRRDARAWLVAAAFALVLAAAASSIVKPRFRFPLDPLLIAFAPAAFGSRPRPRARGDAQRRPYFFSLR